MGLKACRSTVVEWRTQQGLGALWEVVRHSGTLLEFWGTKWGLWLCSRLGSTVWSWVSLQEAGGFAGAQWETGGYYAVAGLEAQLHAVAGWRQYSWLEVCGSTVGMYRRLGTLWWVEDQEPGGSSPVNHCFWSSS